MTHPPIYNTSTNWTSATQVRKPLANPQHPFETLKKKIVAVSSRFRMKMAEGLPLGMSVKQDEILLIVQKNHDS